MSINYGWLVYSGLGLIILELLLGVDTGFDLVLVGVSLLVGGGAAWLTGNFVVGLGVAIVLAIAYLFLGRKLVKKSLFKYGTRTNIDRLINQEALVVTAIKPHYSGQVKINGEVWRASASQNFSSGAAVVVEGVDGVTLKVKQKG